MNRHITLRMTLLTTGAALATLLIVEHRIEARRPSSNVPLQIEFASQESDRMRGDGLVYEHGIGSVVAYIDQSALIFSTDTGSGTGGRTLEFTFDRCLLEPPDTCKSPFGSTPTFAPAGVLAAPRSATGGAVTNGLLGMKLGQTLPAFFQIQVKGQPEEWTLCMKPESSGFCANSPSGVYGRVTRRLQPDTWDFYADSVPDALGTRSDVADLLSTTGSGKRKVISMEGTYSMPFRFTATCVNPSSCS